MEVLPLRWPCPHPARRATGSPVPSPLFLELRLFFRLSKIWADWIHRDFKSLRPSNVRRRLLHPAVCF